MPDPSTWPNYLDVYPSAQLLQAISLSLKTRHQPGQLHRLRITQLEHTSWSILVS